MGAARSVRHIILAGIAMFAFDGFIAGGQVDAGAGDAPVLADDRRPLPALPTPLAPTRSDEKAGSTTTPSARKSAAPTQTAPSASPAAVPENVQPRFRLKNAGEQTRVTVILADDERVDVAVDDAAVAKKAIPNTGELVYRLESDPEGFERRARWKPADAAPADKGAASVDVTLDLRLASPSDDIHLRLRLPRQGRTGQTVVITEFGEDVTLLGNRWFTTKSTYLNSGDLHYRIQGDPAGFPRQVFWNPRAIKPVDDGEDGFVLCAEVELDGGPLADEVTDPWLRSRVAPFPAATPAWRRLLGGPDRVDSQGLPVAERVYLNLRVPRLAAGQTVEVTFRAPDSDGGTLRVGARELVTDFTVPNTGMVEYRFAGDRDWRVARWRADKIPPTFAGLPVKQPVAVLALPLGYEQPPARGTLYLFRR